MSRSRLAALTAAMAAPCLGVAGCANRHEQHRLGLGRLGRLGEGGRAHLRDRPPRRRTARSTSTASRPASTTPPRAPARWTAPDRGDVRRRPGEPATAVSQSKDLIGKGYKIIAGTADSGVALQVAPLAAQNKVLFISGPAAADAITGVNKYTFRSGRQTYQDVATAGGHPSATARARRSSSSRRTAPSARPTSAAVKAVLGGAGATVTRCWCRRPPPTSPRSRAGQADAKPDLLFVAWAGTTAPRCGRRSTSRACSTRTTVVTGLATSATYGRLRRRPATRSTSWRTTSTAPATTT